MDEPSISDDYIAAVSAVLYAQPSGQLLDMLNKMSLFTLLRVLANLIEWSEIEADEVITPLRIEGIRDLRYQVMSILLSKTAEAEPF